MKRYEWFNQIEGVDKSAEEQMKGIVRAYAEEEDKDILDVYERRAEHYLNWLNEEYVPKNKSKNANDKLEKWLKRL